MMTDIPKCKETNRHNITNFLLAYLTNIKVCLHPFKPKSHLTKKDLTYAQ